MNHARMFVIEMPLPSIGMLLKGIGCLADRMGFLSFYFSQRITPSSTV